MRQPRSDRKIPGWFGLLAGLTLFAVAGCETVAPPPLPPAVRTVKPDDQTQVVDARTA